MMIKFKMHLLTLNGYAEKVVVNYFSHYFPSLYISLFLGFQFNETELFSTLVEKQTFEKLMSLCCYAEDREIKVFY